MIECASIIQGYIGFQQCQVICMHLLTCGEYRTETSLSEKKDLTTYRLLIIYNRLQVKRVDDSK